MSVNKNVRESILARVSNTIYGATRAIRFISNFTNGEYIIYLEFIVYSTSRPITAIH